MQKHSKTTIMELTLQANASPEQSALFDYFTKQGPVDAINFLFELSKASSWQNAIQRTNEEKIEESILNQLQDGKVHMDDLIRKADFPTHMVSAQLLVMELNGLVKKLVGNFYVLTKPSHPLPLRIKLADCQSKRKQKKRVISNSKKPLLQKRDTSNLPQVIYEFFADKPNLRQDGITSNEAVLAWLRGQGYAKRAQELREVVNNIREEVEKSRLNQQA